jgi:hypothetical protein
LGRVSFSLVALLHWKATRVLRILKEHLVEQESVCAHTHKHAYTHL